MRVGVAEGNVAVDEVNLKNLGVEEAEDLGELGHGGLAEAPDPDVHFRQQKKQLSHLLKELEKSVRGPS
jgi:hypothetical protein